LALYYLETSALVKLYIREPGTDELIRLASRTANNQFAVLVLSQVEFRSAVRKRQRVHDLDETVASELIARFEKHLATKYVRQQISDSVLDVAAALVDRHLLRAYDSIQLAGCLALRQMSGENEPTFVCSDRDLLKAAEAEGLQILEPVR
jgi:uncharacterized protein